MCNNKYIRNDYFKFNLYISFNYLKIFLYKKKERKKLLTFPNKIFY